MLPSDIRCEQCGGTYELVEKRGHMELFQCMECGATKAFHASPPVDELYELSRNSVEVVIVWDKPPNVKDLAELRREVESLQGTTLTDLKHRVVGNTFSLGKQSHESAQELSQRLQSLGIHLVFRKPL